jgi:phage replication-related protein YjqB (UPF0714/DUF867 family)
MRDRYESFSELARHEVEGADYRVRARERWRSPVIILAPHGGRIENGTSELAEQIAGEEYSLFCFEGVKPRGSIRDLHVTSHRFDHPTCLALLARSHSALAIHGCVGAGCVYVGGRDEALAARLTLHLRAAGFDAQADGHRYPGRDALNICNRAARGCGAQLEFTPDLRVPTLRLPLSEAIRTALAEHVTWLEAVPPVAAPLSRAGARQRLPRPER